MDPRIKGVPFGRRSPRYGGPHSTPSHTPSARPPWHGPFTSGFVAGRAFWGLFGPTGATVLSTASQAPPASFE